MDRDSSSGAARSRASKAGIRREASPSRTMPSPPRRLPPARTSFSPAVRASQHSCEGRAWGLEAPKPFLTLARALWYERLTNVNLEEQVMQYELVSADSHIIEPPDLWEKWLPRKFQDRAPTVVDDGEGGHGWDFHDGGK